MKRLLILLAMIGGLATIGASESQAGRVRVYSGYGGYGAYGGGYYGGYGYRPNYGYRSYYRPYGYGYGGYRGGYYGGPGVFVRW